MADDTTLRLETPLAATVAAASLNHVESDDLTGEEKTVLTLLLDMTGREERLDRKPLVGEDQVAGIRAVWPMLKSRETDPAARCELLNRLLLTLGIKTVSQDFCDTVFPDEVDFSDLKEIERRVHLFRVLSMLEYGSFRFGYKQFREGSSIIARWKHHFPTRTESSARAKRLRGRLAHGGLVSIPGSQLFSLGYLASEHATNINGARKKLLTVIEGALESRVTGLEGLLETARGAEISSLTDLLSRAGIPRTEELIYADMPLYGSTHRSYTDILLSLREQCITVDEGAIARARNDGLQNSRTYMSMRNLDVYVATSMREPLHFTSNWAFVQQLFHQGELADSKTRYFDPTQAFLKDRIQKGLLECLMIKRSRLTVYNAQESDTFGKDAEAGVTLAQAKPVIVYVARMFEWVPALREVYEVIDAGARLDRDRFVEAFASRGLISPAQRLQLLGAEKTRADAVTTAVTERAREAVREMPGEKVALELMRLGYDPTKTGGDIVEYATGRIVALERRALTFRDIHPLSLQASPMDGVARGVIVTRTVEETRRVVWGLFVGTMEYDIVKDEDNWLLVEQVTGSPVRVVTKDPVLTAAIWGEKWGLPEREEDIA